MKYYKQITVLIIYLLLTMVLIIPYHKTIGQSNPLATKDAGTEILQGITDVGEKSGLGGSNSDVRVTIGYIINALLGSLGIIFTVLIIYGGFTWMMAAGNEEKVAKAKKILSNSTIGLLIIIIAYALSEFIFNIIMKGIY